MGQGETKGQGFCEKAGRTKGSVDFVREVVSGRVGRVPSDEDLVKLRDKVSGAFLGAQRNHKVPVAFLKGRAGWGATR